LACDSEKFSGSEPTAVDGRADGAGNDGGASANDGGAGDATTSSDGGDAGTSGIQIQCGGSVCDRVCCYSEDAGTATCQASSEPCFAPKRRFLCDNGADCAAQGLPGFECCAVDVSGLLSSQCEKTCSNTEWRLCDAVSGGKECLGDIEQGENCRPLVDRDPPGFSACQR
jgi:hypothetical protein